MDWTELISRMQGQESIFWVAAASIAAGATLLLISGLVLAKRGLVRGFMVTLKKNRSVPTRTNQVKLTETGYSASTLTMAPTPPAMATFAGHEFSELNSRLKKAANTLEEIQQSLIRDDQMIGISGLKASLQDVEYVFKTGIG